MKVISDRSFSYLKTQIFLEWKRDGVGWLQIHVPLSMDVCNGRWHHHCVGTTQRCTNSGSPTSRIECLMIWGGADIITITEIKYIIHVMFWNHLETIFSSPTPSMEKLSYMKSVPGAREVGDRCPKLKRITARAQRRLEWWLLSITLKTAPNAGGLSSRCSLSTCFISTKKLSNLPFFPKIVNFNYKWLNNFWVLLGMGECQLTSWVQYSCLYDDNGQVGSFPKLLLVSHYQKDL